MLPNLSLPTIELFGPVKIHPFGTFVAFAVVLGYWLAMKRAKATGLDLQIAADASLWALTFGFVISHLFWAILYNYDIVRENPLILVMVWKGISSYGGFFGGSLGGWVYLKRKKISPLPYFEAMLFGFVPAWVIARLGCTTAFDHPGLPTDFFLGMADRAGIVRHNLGLYEAMWTLVIAILLYALKDYRPFRTFAFTMVFLLYAPVRFFLDSLRVEDRTYMGLTPGHYFSVILTGFGLYLLFRGIRERREKERIETQA